MDYTGRAHIMVKDCTVRHRVFILINLSLHSTRRPKKVGPKAMVRDATDNPAGFRAVGGNVQASHRYCQDSLQVAGN